MIAETAWGIPRERVIGTAPTYTYADGVIKRGGELWEGYTLGPGKPERIFAYAGRMPAIASSQRDVDIEMLESRRLLDFDRSRRRQPETCATPSNSVAAAKAHGWTLVSVKDDWNAVF